MRTHMEGTEIGYEVQQLPTSVRLSPDVRCFTIYQLGCMLDLSETKLPTTSLSTKQLLYKTSFVCLINGLPKDLTSPF